MRKAREAGYHLGASGTTVEVVVKAALDQLYATGFLLTPAVREAAGRSGYERARKEIEPAVRALWDVYDTWMNKVDCYDPGDMEGIASLIGTDGSWEMERATTAVEPFEATVKQWLGPSDG